MKNQEALKDKFQQYMHTHSKMQMPQSENPRVPQEEEESYEYYDEEDEQSSENDDLMHKKEVQIKELKEKAAQEILERDKQMESKRANILKMDATLNAKITKEDVQRQPRRQDKINDIDMGENNISCSSIPKDVFYDDMSSISKSNRDSKTNEPRRTKSKMEQSKSGPDMRAQPYEDKSRFRNHNHTTMVSRNRAETLNTPYADNSKKRRSELQNSPSVSTSSDKSKIGIVDYSHTKKGKPGGSSSLARQLDDAFTRKLSKNSNQYDNSQSNSKAGQNDLKIEDIEEEKDDAEENETLTSPINNPKNLQKQFSQATKSQQLIQQRYKELWSWQGVKTDTIKFEEYRMEGYLRKFVEKVKFFQKTLHPKRYFVIDFTIASIIISHEKPTKAQMKNPEANKDWIIMPFRDITDCYPPNQVIDGKSLPNNWPFPFYLQTQSRLFVLCAKRTDERKMWIAGFRYVIASTVTVQCIMKHNNRKSDTKMKQLTDKLHAKGTRTSMTRGDSLNIDTDKQKFQPQNVQNKRKETTGKSQGGGINEEVYQEGTPQEGQQLFKSSAQIRREQMFANKNKKILEKQQKSESQKPADKEKKERVQENSLGTSKARTERSKTQQSNFTTQNPDKSKEQNKKGENPLKSEVNSMIKENMLKIQEEKRKKRKLEMEQKMAELQKKQQDLQKSRQESLEVLLKFKNIQAHNQSQLKSDPTQIIESSRQRERANMSQAASDLNNPMKALKLLEDSGRHKKETSNQQSTTQETLKVLSNQKSTQPTLIQGKNIKYFNNKIEKQELAQARKRKEEYGDQSTQNFEFDRTFGPRGSYNDIQPVTHRIENVLEEITFEDSRGMPDQKDRISTYLAQKREEPTPKPVNEKMQTAHPTPNFIGEEQKSAQGNDLIKSSEKSVNQQHEQKKDLYEGWLVDKEKHVYQVDMVQPVSLESTCSPINLSKEIFRSKKQPEEKVADKNTGEAKKAEAKDPPKAPQFKPFVVVDDDLEIMNSCPDDPRQLKEEPILELNVPSPQSKFRKKNKSIIDLSTMQDMATRNDQHKPKMMSKNQKGHELYRDFGSVSVGGDSIESPTFIKKKKRLEDFLESQRSYNDDDLVKPNSSRKNDRYRNNNLKNSESQRVIRVHRVSRGHTKSQQSLHNESIHSSQNSLKHSYQNSISNFSNKSLVDLFKERDQYMHESGQYQRHHRSSSKWFRESKKRIRQMRREEEARKSGQLSVASVSNHGQHDASVRAEHNDFSQPHEVYSHIPSQNKTAQNRSPRQTKEEQINIVNENLQKRKRKISIQNQSQFKNRILRKESTSIEVNSHVNPEMADHKKLPEAPRQMRSVTVGQTEKSPNERKELAMSNVREAFDQQMMVAERQLSSQESSQKSNVSQKSRKVRRKVIKISRKRMKNTVRSDLSTGPQIMIQDEEQGITEYSSIPQTNHVSRPAHSPVHGSIYNLLDQIDQGSNTSIEIETSVQSYQQVPSEHSQDGRSRFQNKKTVSKREVQTIETADDLNRLEKHLRNLNGKIVEQKTKINAKTGKKTRIIKIKRRRSKDRTASSQLIGLNTQPRTTNETPNTGLQVQQRGYQNNSTLRQLQRNYHDPTVFSPGKNPNNMVPQQNNELKGILDEVRSKVRNTVSKNSRSPSSGPDGHNPLQKDNQRQTGIGSSYQSGLVDYMNEFTKKQSHDINQNRNQMQREIDMSNQNRHDNSQESYQFPINRYDPNQVNVDQYRYSSSGHGDIKDIRTSHSYRPSHRNAYGANYTTSNRDEQQYPARQYSETNSRQTMMDEQMPSQNQLNFYSQASNSYHYQREPLHDSTKKRMMMNAPRI